MVKVSVLYPHRDGARFDHAYYRDRHLPMIQEKLGTGLLRYTIDKGLAGARPDSPPAFVAMCHLYFASAEAFPQNFGPHAKAVMADVPNYTDIAPVLQVSEVVVD